MSTKHKVDFGLTKNFFHDSIYLLLDFPWKNNTSLKACPVCAAVLLQFSRWSFSLSPSSPDSELSQLRSFSGLFRERRAENIDYIIKRRFSHFHFHFPTDPEWPWNFLSTCFLLIFLRIIIPLPHSLPQHLLTSAEKLWRKQSNKAEIFVLYVDDVSRWPIFHLCSLRLLASVLGTTQCVLSPLQWRHKFSILFLSLSLAVNWNRSPLGYRSGGSKIK